MTPEEIKVGETYNVRVKVTLKTESGNIKSVTVDQNGHTLAGNTFYVCETPAFSPITPENGIKNTEKAPKYDPCRLFRKGDKVRIVKYKGRVYNANFVNAIGEEVFVTEDEEYLCEVQFKDSEQRVWYIDPAYLELVTPVEELEPYSVVDDVVSFSCIKPIENGVNRIIAVYFKDAHPHAKEAAEAECARLNAAFTTLSPSANSVISPQ